MLTNNPQQEANVRVVADNIKADAQAMRFKMLSTFLFEKPMNFTVPSINGNGAKMNPLTPTPRWANVCFCQLLMVEISADYRTKHPVRTYVGKIFDFHF